MYESIDKAETVIKAINKSGKGRIYLLIRPFSFTFPLCRCIAVGVEVWRTARLMIDLCPDCLQNQEKPLYLCYPKNLYAAQVADVFGIFCAYR